MNDPIIVTSSPATHFPGLTPDLVITQNSISEIFIHWGCTEHLLSARHCGRRWRLQNKQDTVYQINLKSSRIPLSNESFSGSSLLPYPHYTCSSTVSSIPDCPISPRLSSAPSLFSLSPSNLESLHCLLSSCLPALWWHPQCHNPPSDLSNHPPAQPIPRLPSVAQNNKKALHVIDATDLRSFSKVDPAESKE